MSRDFWFSTKSQKTFRLDSETVLQKGKNDSGKKTQPFATCFSIPQKSHCVLVGTFTVIFLRSTTLRADVKT